MSVSSSDLVAPPARSPGTPVRRLTSPPPRSARGVRIVRAIPYALDALRYE